MKRISVIAALLLCGCAPANLEQTKAAACDAWARAGYECIGYEGFQWGFWLGGNYGGALVWHSLKRKENPQVIYSGFVQSWGGEYHLYGPRAIDAIGGTK